MSTVFLPPSHVYQNHHLDSTHWDAYTPRPDDVIISTAYKSGTTWLTAIVRELIVHAMQQAGEMDPAKLPTPDGGSCIWLDYRYSEGAHAELRAKLEAQQHRRFLKSHLPLDGLPIHRQVRYLVIVRDPRDVFMSFWNHYSGYTDHAYANLNDEPGRRGEPLPRCPADIHDLWAMWISRGWFDWEKEGYPFWGNMSHAQSWWDYRHLGNFLLLHYADMIADPQREIRCIADFLEIEISNEGLAQVVQDTSLEAMRQRAFAAETGEPQSFRDGAKTFFYQGTNGRWQNVLTEAELAMYEQTKANVLTLDCARWLELGRAGLQ